MIKANDFRVGNYIMYNESNTWLKVEYIAKTAIGAIDTNNISFYHFKENEIKPIPLTPEILEKVAVPVNPFLRIGYIPKYRYDFESVLANATESDTTFRIEIIPFGFFRFQYLHKLQNVYYELKGEELQIDLKDFVTIK